MYCICNNLLIQMNKQIYIYTVFCATNTALQLFSFCPITLWLPVTCLKGNTARFAVILHTKFPVAPLDQCFSNGGKCTTGGKQRVNWRFMKLFEN